MIDEKYIKLIHRNLSGGLSQEDHLALQNWLDQTPENRQAYQQLEKAWQLSKDFSANYLPDVDRGLEKLQKRIQADKTESVAPHTSPLTPKRSFPIPLAAAAAILLVISAFAVWNFWLKPADMMVVTTLDGEKKNIVLDDGSTVVLNENSRLQFPSFFGDIRQVELSGEGYFEIKRDEAHPFLVRTPKTVTEVLGTSFNVRAYENESFTEIEVTEGLVNLGTIQGGQTIQLEKGSRGTFQHETETLSPEHPKALNANYWKEGHFRFRGHELSEAIDEINTRLGIHIEISNSDQDLQNCLLTQKIDLTNPDTLISIIAEHYGAKVVKKNDDNYVIEGGRCPSSN